jgi:GMP synthase PP-ATPase subunit
MDTLNDKGSVLCVYVIQALLQSDEVNNVVNMLYFMVNEGGVKMRQSGEKCRGNRHWSDEESTESKRKSRETLKDFNENINKASRIKYWESRKKR